MVSSAVSMERLSAPRSARSQGMLLAGATAVISGLAVFVNGYGVRAWAEVADPTTYTTLKNGVAALILSAVLIATKTRRGDAGSWKPQRPGEWGALGVVAVVGGAVPFVLFFEGLALASSVQAAFIHKTLVVWVAILAVGILRERLGRPQLVAIVLLVVGHATLAGGLEGMELGLGETLIFFATLLWSIEVILAKRLLSTISS
ncbi:MAG TPA: EamA family transporter, partial [Acidimicrobiia bacterium]|nr:EamA family transporter [Acidimicrobiia bacterium]